VGFADVVEEEAGGGFAFDRRGCGDDELFYTRCPGGVVEAGPEVVEAELVGADAVDG